MHDSIMRRYHVANQMTNNKTFYSWFITRSFLHTSQYRAVYLAFIYHFFFKALLIFIRYFASRIIN